MQPHDPSASVEEVVLVDPDPHGADLGHDDPAGSARIVLGLALIFLAISIGTASLARERRWGHPAPSMVPGGRRDVGGHPREHVRRRPTLPRSGGPHR